MCQKYGKKKLMAFGHWDGKGHRPNWLNSGKKMLRAPKRPIEQSYLYLISTEQSFVRAKLYPNRADGLYRRPSKLAFYNKLDRYDNRGRKGLSKQLAEEGKAILGENW